MWSGNALPLALPQPLWYLLRRGPWWYQAGALWFLSWPPLGLPGSFQWIGNPDEGSVLGETKGLSRRLEWWKNLFRNKIWLINQEGTSMPGPSTRSAKQSLHEGTGGEGFLRQLTQSSSIPLSSSHSTETPRWTFEADNLPLHWAVGMQVTSKPELAQLNQRNAKLSYPARLTSWGSPPGLPKLVHAPEDGRACSYLPLKYCLDTS